MRLKKSLSDALDETVAMVVQQSMLNHYMNIFIGLWNFNKKREIKSFCQQLAGEESDEC
jgi:hypothetical protein